MDESVFAAIDLPYIEPELRPTRRSRGFWREPSGVALILGRRLGCNPSTRREILEHVAYGFASTLDTGMA
jgi:hypothetical protein